MPQLGKDDKVHLTSAEKEVLAKELIEYGKNKIKQGQDVQECQPCLAQVLEGAYALYAAEVLSADDAGAKANLAIVSEQFAALLHDIANSLTLSALFGALGQEHMLERLEITTPMQ